MAWTTPRDWTAGELVTEAIMDTHIKGNFDAVGPHLIVRKSADESVVSSTALQDDDSLTLAVAANEVWLVNLAIRYEADAAADLKFSFGIPTSSRFEFHAAHLDAANATTVVLISLTATDGSSAPLAGAGAGVGRFQPINGVYVGAGTAGNLTFRWAQNASSATATKVLTHSTLWAVKLA